MSPSVQTPSRSASRSLPPSTPYGEQYQNQTQSPAASFHVFQVAPSPAVSASASVSVASTSAPTPASIHMRTDALMNTDTHAYTSTDRDSQAAGAGGRPGYAGVKTEADLDGEGAMGQTHGHTDAGTGQNGEQKFEQNEEQMAEEQRAEEQKAEEAMKAAKATVDVAAVREEVRLRGQQKARRREEISTMADTAERIAQRLADDHAAALRPDVDAPFADAADVVRRLLPYHVFQHPAEDLRALVHPHGKGKRKATAAELLREEIEETRFALRCARRKTALERRFRAVRTRAGKRTAPDDQTYALAHAVLEADRAETAALNSAYRAAKAEFDAADRRRKLAAMAQPMRIPPAQPSASTSASARGPANTMNTTNANANATPAYAAAASTPNYGVTAPPQAYGAASSYTQYRGYTYTYPQTYGTPYSYTPYANTASAPGYPQTATQGAYAPQPTQPSYQEAQTASEASSGTPNPGGTPVARATAIATAADAGAPAPPTAPSATPSAPIPVVLPVGALGQLAGMGIIPVAAANAPPAGEAQPAAVIKGTTQNGTMVNLEINVSALQAAQAGKLAVLLAALTGRGAEVGAETAG